MSITNQPNIEIKSDTTRKITPGSPDTELTIREKKFSGI